MMITILKPLLKIHLGKSLLKRRAKVQGRRMDDAFFLMAAVLHNRIPSL